MASSSENTMWGEVRALKTRICELEALRNVKVTPAPPSIIISPYGWQDTLNKSSILNRDNVVINIGHTFTFQDGKIAMTSVATPKIVATYDYGSINITDTTGDPNISSGYHGGLNYNATTKSFFVTFFDDTTGKFFDIASDLTRGFYVGQQLGYYLFRVTKDGDTYMPHIVPADTTHTKSLYINPTSGQVAIGDIPAEVTTPDLQAVTDIDNKTNRPLIITDDDGNTVAVLSNSGGEGGIGLIQLQTGANASLYGGRLDKGNTSGFTASTMADNLTSNHYLQEPDGDGTYAISATINGVTIPADTTGNINLGTIGGGGSGIGGGGGGSVSMCTGDPDGTGIYSVDPTEITATATDDTPILIYFFTKIAFASDNVFTAEMSNEHGDFSGNKVTVLGQVTSNVDGNTTINGIIPANMTPGNGYLIQIVSSSPASCSSNQVQFTIDDVSGGGGGGGITGSGTVPQLAFWNAATGLGSTGNAYWDSTNNRIVYGATTAPLIPSGIAISPVFINSNIYGIAYGGSRGISFLRAQGTQAAPKAVTQGLNLAFFGGGGYDGTAFTLGSTGFMQIASAEAWTTSAHGTYIGFNTTPSGSTVTPATAQVRIYSSGQLQLNTGIISTPDTGDGARFVSVDTVNPQTSWRYDNTVNYANVQVGSSGQAIFTAFGSGAAFRLSNTTYIGATANGIKIFPRKTTDPDWGTRGYQIDEATMEIRMYCGNNDTNASIKWGGDATQGGNHFGELRLAAGHSIFAGYDQNFVTIFTCDNTTPFTSQQRMVVNGFGQIGIGTPKMGTGTGSPAIQAAYLDPSAILQIDSTTRGVLIPRMTKVQRDAFVTALLPATPALGLMIYNTDDFNINIYTGQTTNGWQKPTLQNSP